tara:strand:+ start:16084 stop:17238 length:1155 start_codon:yes stop_codon:yes gene_type:complete
MLTSKTLVPALVAFLLAAPAAYADATQSERVEAKTGAEEPVFEGSIIGTYQGASDGRIDEEASLRPELFVTLPVPGAGGELHVHIEGTTTPRVGGVTSFLGNSNTNVGTATNGAGHGRLQISELFYEFELGSVGLSAGLIDTSAFIDSSAFANDERTQFMNSSLVHNTTIEFPDYTLGLVLTTQGEGALPGFTFLAASTSGLGDNPSHSYPDLFDVRSTGKGLFGAVEAGWGLEDLGEEGALRLGVWTNTADHAYVDLRPGTTTNHGIYGVLEGTAAGNGWSLRAGAADQDASAAEWFVGGAVQRQVTDEVLVGLGVTETGVNEDLGASFSDSTEAEVYVKYDVLPYLNLTPSVQWVRNPGFDDTGAVVDQDNWVYGLRVGFAM